jgi:hypothetical protein
MGIKRNRQVDLKKISGGFFDDIGRFFEDF